MPHPSAPHPRGAPHGRGAHGGRGSCSRRCRRVARRTALRSHRERSCSGQRGEGCRYAGPTREHALPFP
jgi:hypothetical protein